MLHPTPENLPQSIFDQIRKMTPDAKKEFLGDRFEQVSLQSFGLHAHFGTDEVLGERLLPALAVVRDIMVRSEEKRFAPDSDPIGELNSALTRGNHLNGGVWTWEAQRDALMRAYLIDRQAIDAALDAQKGNEAK
jgi:hypothetical protein